MSNFYHTVIHSFLIAKEGTCMYVTEAILYIPNGCFDAYEVKVNKDISKYQEKVKLISQFQMAY